VPKFKVLLMYSHTTEWPFTKKHLWCIFC